LRSVDRLRRRLKTYECASRYRLRANRIKIPAPSGSFAASNDKSAHAWLDPLFFYAPAANRERKADTVTVKPNSRVPRFKGGNRMESSAAKQQPVAGGSMTTAEQTYLRSELQQRRERLHEALHSPAADASLTQLLTDVDTALSRIDEGTFGLCETCHDSIEADRLLVDPLVRFCLDHLTSAEQRALESDLSLAARIQRALLPKAGLAPDGWDVHYHYQPAGMVSGDYCDLFETDGGLLFMLGDVSGKGVAASMLMSHLHATFRSLAEAGLPLDRMVADANRIFCESTLAGQFATLVVGRAARDGAVEFVSAGHLPLLHIHGEHATPKDSTGVPLGMFCNARFPVHRLALADGDTLFLYTDGLTEARNRAGVEYGLDRIRALAARRTEMESAGLISECLADLLSFQEGLKQTDDLALLAVRRAD
jgi:sigma-B regulation protein RsbU (phosphoserine phosphatase)